MSLDVEADAELEAQLLLGFAGSLLIETLQMLTGRGLFQLDDLITNAAGMMAGYGIYQIAKKLWKRVYKSRFQ